MPSVGAGARLRRLASVVAMWWRPAVTAMTGPHSRGLVPDVPVRGRHSMYALMTGTVCTRRSRHGDDTAEPCWAVSHQAGHTTSGRHRFSHDWR